MLIALKLRRMTQTITTLKKYFENEEILLTCQGKKDILNTSSNYPRMDDE